MADVGHFRCYPVLMAKVVACLTSANLVLAALVGCTQPSAELEKTGHATDAIVSAELNLACEPGAIPGVAVRSGVALAAWAASDGSVHAVRFDQDGNVLGSVPIALGVPGHAFGETVPVLRMDELLVVPTLTGFSVVAAFSSTDLAQDAFYTVQARTVDLSGATTGGWQVVHMRSTVTGIPSADAVLGGGFDGTHSYVAFLDMYSQGSSPTFTYHVYQLGGGGEVLVVKPHENPPAPGWYNPTWGGFGCGTSGCLATWADAETNTPRAQVLGQSLVTIAGFHQGPVVGTPSGFLQVGNEAVAFSPTGQLTAGPTSLIPSAAEHQAAFDGVATRATWANATDGTYSATLGDDTMVLTAPSIEIPSSGWLTNNALASFGAGRSVLVHASATGVVARFIGAVPVSVPSGCPGSGSGGAGGAGATATSTATSTTATSTATSTTATGSGGAGGMGTTNASTGVGGGGTTGSTGTAGGSGGATVTTGTSGSVSAATGAGGASVSGATGQSASGVGGGSVATTGSGNPSPAQSSGCSIDATSNTDASTGIATIALASALAFTRRRTARHMHARLWMRARGLH